MNAEALLTPKTWFVRGVEQGTILALRPLQWFMTVPSLLFLGTLGVMLFRPPNIEFYSLDRFALAILIFTIILRALMTHQRLPSVGAVALPLLFLTILGFTSVLQQPFDAANWSVFAAKYVVPFVLFHLAGLVFEDSASLGRFETFALITLAYLMFIAIAFAVGARSLIFPRFILDESIGIHVDRARGPFLQAVANGVSMNLLGLVALDSYRRHRLRKGPAIVFMLCFPIAIAATKTRAVWLSSAAALAVLLIFCRDPRVRRACHAIVLVMLAGAFVAAMFATYGSSLGERFRDASPVDYRVAMYDAGWQMFMEKPLLGWSPSQIQPELSSRIRDFHVETFILHNTYLEMAVEHGLVGLALYFWLLVDLFRIGRAGTFPAPRGTFLDSQFRSLWPLMILVFIVNALFVVMNYQFVSGLLFTLAGMLAAQNRRSEIEPIRQDSN